ncbi:MAG: RidA family protein [Burkholderiaceae bacterium]
MIEATAGAKRRRILTPLSAEPAAGMWSNCYAIGNLVVIAGLTGRDSEGKLVAEGDSYAQSLALFRKMKGFVEAAGGRMNDVIKMNCFVSDIRYREGFVRARKEFFSGDFPPCTVVGNASFANPGPLVEVDAWAIVGSSPDE